jgi:hypothetical protein
MPDENKVSHAERCKQWRLKNAEKLWAREKCECGSTYAASSRVPHLRTQKHKRYESYQLELESIRAQVGQVSQSKN